MPAFFAQVQNATANAAGAAFGGFFLLILLAGLLYLALWLYCLINAATRRDFDTGQRVLWVVVLLFLHGLGPILYLLLARRSV